MTMSIKYKGNPPIPVDSKYPPNPEQLVMEHVKGSNLVYDDVLAIDYTSPPNEEYEVPMVVKDAPRFWLTDEVYIEFDITVYFEVNSGRSRIYIIADLKRECPPVRCGDGFVAMDTVQNEFSEHYGEKYNRWLTIEQIDSILQHYAREVIAGMVLKSVNLSVKTQ